MMFCVLYVIGNVELGRQIRARSNLKTVHMNLTIEAIKVDKIA